MREVLAFMWMGCAANSTFFLTENCEQIFLEGGKVQVFYSLEVFGSYK